MKKYFLLLAACFTLNQIAFSQITNTFPLNDSVGVGTTTPSALFEVYGGDAIINFNRVGYGANYGGTVLGEEALKSNISGDYNVAVGQAVLTNNLSGETNTAVGAFSLKYNKTGSYNCAYGFNSLSINNSGNYNTAIGNSALFNNYTGGYNVGVGTFTLHANAKGSYNTAIGSNSLYQMEKGMNNTVVGANAFYYPTKGNNNTALGYNTDMSGNFMNATALGNQALVDASNKVRIGNASVTSNGGQVNWTAYSDGRIKNSVQQNVPGLEFINLLNPVTYHFDVDKQNALTGRGNIEKVEGMYDIEKIQFTGFIAQEVQAAAQQIKYDFSGVDTTGSLMGLRYAEFVVPLVKAVQELSQQNTEMQKQIDDLKNQVATMQTTAINNIANDGVIEMRTADENSGMLGQNVPNPFNNSTLIPFRIPQNCRDASIMILNTAEGKVITVIPISCTQTHISIDAGTLAAGTYTYSLLVDGKIIDTKQMILAK